MLLIASGDRGEEPVEGKGGFRVSVQLSQLDAGNRQKTHCAYQCKIAPWRPSLLVVSRPYSSATSGSRRVTAARHWHRSATPYSAPAWNPTGSTRISPPGGMTNVLENLAPGGHRVAISDEALAGLSPYQTDHINRFGDYVLDLSTPPAPLPFMLPNPPPAAKSEHETAISDPCMRFWRGSSPWPEIVQRLLAQRCEHCGSEDGPFEVHHVRRLADLDRPGRREVAAQVVEDEARSAGPKRAGALPPVQRRAQTRAGQQGMSRDDASRA